MGKLYICGLPDFILHQLTFSLQVLLIVIPILFIMIIGLDTRLQQNHPMIEPGISKQSPQALLAYDALTYTRMDITVTAQCHLRIIQVDHLQAVEPNYFVKMLEHLMRWSSSGDIVSCPP